MLYDTMLEISYTSPKSFALFTHDNPGIKLSYWCNNRVDIIELKGTSESIQEALNHLNQYFGEIKFLNMRLDEKPVFFKVCQCQNLPLFPILDKYDCLDVPPIHFIDGKEYMRLIITAVATEDLLTEIEDHVAINAVKMLKLAPLSVNETLYPLYLSLEDLLNNLTLKQINSITQAYYKGYYEIPRRVTTEKLAETMKISRRTFEEHLRKTENEIMAHIIPVLMMKKKMLENKSFSKVQNHINNP
ncbi:MAG: helix-turn-helix domain-containing protein [Candidatus Hermodarchaeota archaeon]